MLCVCVTEYLDEAKQEKGVTERRDGAKKKGSQKAEVVWKRKQGSQREKVKIRAGGKILEMGKTLVTRSRCTLATDVIFCPATPGQQ